MPAAPNDSGAMPARSASEPRNLRQDLVGRGGHQRPFSGGKEKCLPFLGDQPRKVDELEDTLLIEVQSCPRRSARRPRQAVSPARRRLRAGPRCSARTPNWREAPSHFGLQDDDPAAEAVGTRPALGQLAQVQHRHRAPRQISIPASQEGEPPSGADRTRGSTSLTCRESNGITIRTAVAHDQQHGSLPNSQSLRCGEEIGHRATR